MKTARDPEYTAHMQRLSGELAKLGFYHSIELPDGSVIPGTQSLETQRWRIGQFPIPEDLRGKRVLDIGAWDGWFSFEMERRGASVVAVDASDKTSFRKTKALLNSKVEYVIADICRLKPRDIGYFDIVLFFGVLYHLKHPMMALENVCELSTGLVCVESFVTDNVPDAPVPTLEFYESDELGGQFDNWVGPNISCLLAMCRATGFATVEFRGSRDDRAHVVCSKKWPETARSGPGPELIVVQNSEFSNHEFTADRDEYLTTWFRTPERDLNCDNVFVQVGPYGARPAGVRSSEGVCQANCKLPLGLAPGWHDVSVAVRDGRWSTKTRIAVDVPREQRLSQSVSNAITIAVVCDGQTWEVNQVRTGYGSCVSTWVAGIPNGTPMTDVAIRLDGTDIPSCYVAPIDDENGAKQVNALVPAGLERSEYQLSVRCREEESRVVRVELF
jgi:tRNA (mo5U34)-methyltransferase